MYITRLIYLNFLRNNLINIDLTKNIYLEQLICESNQLEKLDISKNIKLKNLFCRSNQLTVLDVSNNNVLNNLDCSYNKLVNLNLKNRNNYNFNSDPLYTSFLINPNLTCIQVDDVVYSNANWSELKDATANYSNTCEGLGVEESNLAKISLYPIPANKILHIDNIPLEKVSIYDGLGRVVKTEVFNNNSTKNIIDLSSVAKGIYNLSMFCNNKIIDRKIIIE
jgi:hypothetical protein